MWYLWKLFRSLCFSRSLSVRLASVPSAMREPPNSNERTARSLDSILGLRNRGVGGSSPPPPWFYLNRRENRSRNVQWINTKSIHFQISVVNDFQLTQLDCHSADVQANISWMTIKLNDDQIESMYWNSQHWYKNEWTLNCNSQQLRIEGMQRNPVAKRGLCYDH